VIRINRGFPSVRRREGVLRILPRALPGRLFSFFARDFSAARVGSLPTGAMCLQRVSLGGADTIQAGGSSGAARMPLCQGTSLNSIKEQVMKIPFGFVLVAIALGATMTSASANHSNTMYDLAKKVTHKGTVQEFQYTNPHSWLEVMVTDQDGKPQLWGFESDAPSKLLREGVTPHTFRPGEEITVVSHPLKDGRPAGLLIRATKADGAVIAP
jgi:hypothetical protein